MTQPDLDALVDATSSVMRDAMAALIDRETAIPTGVLDAVTARRAAGRRLCERLKLAGILVEHDTKDQVSISIYAQTSTGFSAYEALRNWAATVRKLENSE